MNAAIVSKQAFVKPMWNDQLFGLLGGKKITWRKETNTGAGKKTNYYSQEGN